MRYLLLFLFSLVFHGAFSQGKLKMVFRLPKDEKARKFVTSCLCNQNAAELLPNHPELRLDTLKRIEVIPRIVPAVKLQNECDGIYYYVLRSEYWTTPTFRGAKGTFYAYQYLVILNKKLIPFQANDRANPAKFQRIRQELIRSIGVQKTDSIRPHLLSGYATF